METMTTRNELLLELAAGLRRAAAVKEVLNFAHMLADTYDHAKWINPSVRSLDGFFYFKFWDTTLTKEIEAARTAVWGNAHPLIGGGSSGVTSTNTIISGVGTHLVVTFDSKWSDVSFKVNGGVQVGSNLILRLGTAWHTDPVAAPHGRGRKGPRDPDRRRGDRRTADQPHPAARR